MNQFPSQRGTTHDPSAVLPQRIGERERSSSAPDRLENTPFSVSIVPDGLGENKFDLIKKHYLEYTQALQQEKTPLTCFTSFFGGRSRREAQKANAQSRLVRSYSPHEELFFNHAMAESLQSFRKQIFESGGNPDIAFEVFSSTVDQLEPLSTGQQESHPSLYGDNLSETDSQGGFRDSIDSTISSDDGITSARSQTPHFMGEEATASKQTLEEMKRSLEVLPEADLKVTLQNLCDDDILALAHHIFDPDVLDIFAPAQKQGHHEISEKTPKKSDPEYINFLREQLLYEFRPRKATSLDISSQKKEKINPNDLAGLPANELREALEKLPETDLRILATQVFEKSILDLLKDFNDSGLRDQLFDHFYSNTDVLNLSSTERVAKIIAAFSPQPLPLEKQGIRNSGVDCYLSSALQLLRKNFEILSLEKQQLILDSLQVKFQSNAPDSWRDSSLYHHGSALAAFLEKRFDASSRVAAAFLRQEVFRMISHVNSGAATQIVSSANIEGGSSREQHDASEALTVLANDCHFPRITLSEQDFYKETGAPRVVTYEKDPQQGGESMITLGGILTPATLGAVIAKNFEADFSGENALSDDDGRKRDVLRKRFLSAPVDTLTFSLSRFQLQPDDQLGWSNLIQKKLQTPITDITQPVLFPVSDRGRTVEVAYEPYSIICHYGGGSGNSGHYATFIKEDGQWYLINDADVTRVNFQSPQVDKNGYLWDYKKFIEENAYIVAARRQS